MLNRSFLTATWVLFLVCSCLPLSAATPLSITTSALPSVTIGTAYSQLLQASGGTTPYSWAITSGSLPAGITFQNRTGVLSGTPTASGTFNFTVTVNDRSSPIQTASASMSIVVAPISTPLVLSPSALPSVTMGATYSQALQASGGTTPYTWSIASGMLPAGLSISSATGVISGTPTATGTFNFTATVTDSSSPRQTASASMAIVVTPTQLALAASTLPPVTVGATYSQILQASGGTTPYAWSIASGSLPAGLSISSATGVISGTPTNTGTFNFTATVIDSSSPRQTVSASMAIVVTPTQLALATSALPSVTVAASYSQALQASGGTTPYTWSIASGTLPAGLSISSATGVISGTPTATGTFNFTATVTDSSSPRQTASASMSIVVTPTQLALAASTLPPVTVGATYSQILQASGGTTPYTWSIASGSLPAGLSISSATGVISGTPTNTGTFNFTATVTDSSSPRQTASASMAIVVTPTQLALATSALPSVTVAASYSQALQASGGTTPYTWSIASGSLPAGLSISSATGVISGTPTATGTFNFTATVTDSSSPRQTASASMSIVVTPTQLALAASTLPPVTVGATYSQNLQASGGTTPYSWSIASGMLPAGLSISSAIGVISGTPTNTGTFNFTATVTDSSSPRQTASASMAIVVTPTQLALATSALPSVTVGASYSQALQASGGTTPYTWSIASGTLPAGLSISAATGIIYGTPTAAGTFNFTATVTDSSSPRQSASASMSIMVAPTQLILAPSTLPSGNLSAAYSQALQASGGTTPYTWSIASGSLPAGLSISAATGIISGTPTAAGTFNFTATVTDSSSPRQSASALMSMVVLPASLALIAPALPSAVTGTTYSQILQASGGTTPYTWSITSGSLPSGMTLQSRTGVLSGTPAASGLFNFTISVSDRSSPVQTASAAMSLVTLMTAAPASPLTITSSTLPNATAGISYSQTLHASGGTAPYTWSITSGSLPPGLSISAATGTISGISTATGTFIATVTVTDSNTPAHMQSAVTSITVTAPVIAGPGTTWYIRPDGGTRYSSNVPTGQCNGQYDAPYPGSGVNQNCAFNDFRYLWSDNSGNPNAWVISGGDTVIVRGCTALPSQQNPSNPDCRLGWDIAANGNAPNYWCGYGNPNYGCYNPPIPPGIAAQHTRFLGQNYAACNVGGATNPQNYVKNLTQLFAGFGLGYALNLASTQYVDVQCIELTTHNGACITDGYPPYPRTCNKNPPVDDFGGSGILTDNASSNITLQDVYIHGFNSSGLFGPIGGPITMTRMFVGFNAFAGWDFDDGSSTPDAPGSSITANYVTMNWNGCYEEYPHVDAIPAQVCYDTNSQGFGDSWSGQATNLNAFSCDHCVDNYNTKDAFIGPHTYINTLSITNSEAIGNMGQSWKWGGLNQPNNVTFTNNLTVGNCDRMSQPMPGAPATYNQYLTGFCRAAGNVVASDISAGSTWTMANNTFVTYQPTIFDIACPTGYSPCPSAVNLTNNIFLGYDNPLNPYGPLTPAIYYIENPSIAISGRYAVEYGIRNGDTCGGNIICSDPLLVGEPPQGSIPPESTLDNFNFTPSSVSPAIGAGTTYTGIPATDYYGTAMTSPPAIGAVQP